MDENNEAPDTSRLDRTAVDPAEGPDPESDAGTIDFSQKVRLQDGAEVSISDLVAAKQRADELENYRNLARRLVTNDGTIDEEYEQAARFLMSDAGYSDEQIEAWMEYQRSAAQSYGDEGVEVDEEDSPVNQGSGKKPSYEDLQARIEEQGRMIEQIMQTNEQSTSEMQEARAQMLRRQLDEALQEASNSDSVRTFAEKLAELDGEKENRLKFMQDEIRKHTLDAIRNKRKNGGRFDPSWFETESKKAAEEVVNKLRTVIGDPDKLRRAPETDAGQDWLVPRGPVKEPELPMHADISQRISEAQRYGSEKLLEALRIGGASKT